MVWMANDLQELPTHFALVFGTKKQSYMAHAETVVQVVEKLVDNAEKNTGVTIPIKEVGKLDVTHQQIPAFYSWDIKYTHNCCFLIGKNKVCYWHVRLTPQIINTRRLLTIAQINEVDFGFLYGDIIAKNKNTGVLKSVGVISCISSLTFDLVCWHIYKKAKDWYQKGMD